MYHKSQNIWYSYFVLDGPYSGQVAIHGPTNGTEGNTVNHRCFSGFTNPASSFRWYNGSKEIILTSQPVISSNSATVSSRKLIVMLIDIINL